MTSRGSGVWGFLFEIGCSFGKQMFLFCLLLLFTTRTTDIHGVRKCSYRMSAWVSKYALLLSRRQTIDKVGQLLGRGLVSKDDRPMKCTTSKLLTCRVTNGGPIWSAFMLFRSQKIKQHKSVGVLIVCHFLLSLSWRDKWRVSWFKDFIGRLSLETKPRPRSWPTLSIVWRRLTVRTCEAGAVHAGCVPVVMTAIRRGWQLSALMYYNGINNVVVYYRESWFG